MNVTYTDYSLDIDSIIIENAYEPVLETEEKKKDELPQEIFLPESIVLETIRELDSLAERAKSNRMIYPTGLSVLDDWCEGGLQPGKLILLAASPNFGKSALLQTITRGLLDLNKDTVAICLSIDDTCSDFLSRYIAGEGGLPIWAVNQTEKRLAHDASKGSNYEQAFQNGYNRFKNFTSKRLMVKGAMDIMSSDRNAPSPLLVIEDLIINTYKQIREITGKRPQLVVTVDSPRNIKIKEGNLASNPTALVEYIGSTVKSWLDLHVEIDGVKERIEPIVITTEHIKKLPKEQKRPGLDDIKDSVTLQYHADMVLLMWNDACYRARVLKTQEPSQMLFERTDLKDKRNGNKAALDPVVELTLGKNKLGRMHYSGSSATDLFYFYQDQSRMVEISDRIEFDTYACYID